MNAKSQLLDQLRIDREPASEERGGGRIPWLVLVLLLVAALLATGVWWWLQAGSTPEVQVQTARPMPARSAASVLDASGYVVARRLATVSAKITGKVTEVLIEEGMLIKQGQIMARLDDASVGVDLALTEAQREAARAQLGEIRVNLADARRQLKRSLELQQRGLASDADLDSANAAVQGLEARLAAGEQQVQVSERAVAVQRQRLADTVIRAPFDGVVIAKAAQPGEMISPVSAGGGFTRTGIGTVVDMESLEVEVDVNEAYIQRVYEGQRVTAVLDAYPDWQIPARVITIIPAADRQKATVRVRISFDALDPRILPDMGVKVAFHSEGEELHSAEQGVLISPDAIRRDGEQAYVFLLRGEEVERRTVRTSGQLGGRISVVAGLAPGQQVVSPLPEGLRDGDRVRVVEPGQTN